MCRARPSPSARLRVELVRSVEPGRNSAGRVGGRRAYSRRFQREAKLAARCVKQVTPRLPAARPKLDQASTPTWVWPPHPNLGQVAPQPRSAQPGSATPNLGQVRQQPPNPNLGQVRPRPQPGSGRQPQPAPTPTWVRSTPTWVRSANPNLGPPPTPTWVRSAGHPQPGSGPGQPQPGSGPATPTWVRSGRPQPGSGPHLGHCPSSVTFPDSPPCRPPRQPVSHSVAGGHG